MPEVADAAAVSQQNIYRLLEGQRWDPRNRKMYELDPRMRTVRKLARAFHVSDQALYDQHLTDLELRTEMSRGALKAAPTRGLTSVEAHRYYVLTDSPDAPVSPEGWRNFIRLSSELRDADAERARMQVPPVPSAQLRLRFPRRRG